MTLDRFGKIWRRAGLSVETLCNAVGSTLQRHRRRKEDAVSAPLPG